VLVVSSSVGVIDGVHGNTTSPGPRVPLRLELVEGSSSLQQRLVDSSSSSDDTDGGSGGSGDGLLGSRRKTKSGLVLVDRVSNDGGVVSGGSGDGSTVTNSLLDVADDGSLGALVKGEDVSDREGGLLSTVDEGSGGHTLSGDESLLSELVSVRVSEDDLGEGRSSSGVVDDILDNTSDVTVPLSEVQGSESRGLLPVVGVRLEDPSGLPLVQDDSSHG